jgi:protein TonB
MKKKSSNYLAPFLTALAMHAAGAYYVGAVLQPKAFLAEPQFVTGVSSVELTLLPPPQREPAPPEVPMVPEPLPAQELPAAVELPEEPEEAPPVEPPADMLDKGVEGETVPEAFVRPVYPYGSIERGEEGVVLVSAVLRGNGSTTNVRIKQTSGYRSLDRAAVDAMKRTVYRSPTGEDMRGREVECPFRFKINQ